ncbi:MAG: ATP-binding protein [Chloroflexota bacterium]|nr:ATP-binding protein [Chloroflexota bacterium]
MPESRELKAESLYRQCDPDSLGFETTSEIKDEVNSVGQERAASAIDFGMNIIHPGYNIFVLGPTGMGKREIVKQFFEKKAKDDPTPPDWVYINDFENPDRPDVIELPAGKGSEYQKDINDLIDEMKTALSAAFESEEYQNRRQTIFDSFKEKQSDLFDELQEKTEAQDLAMIKTPSGIAFAPTDEDGVMSPEEINALDKETRDQIKEKIEAVQEDLQKILQQVPNWQRDAKEEIKDLNKEMANFAIGGLINELKEKYQDYEKIVQHISKIQEQVVENANIFLPANDGEANSFLDVIGQRGGGESALMDMFKANLIVDNSDLEGAPVLFEDNPTYPNLIGRVEHYAQMGTLMTDFRMVKAGALHKANGGYLILDARKLLTQSYSWEGLKRALQSGEIEIESIGQALSLISTVSLKPAPIPLNLKIALIGDRMLYYLLVQHDPEFSELFKVEADFESEIEWDDANQALYAQLIATSVKRNETRPFSNKAVARMIEESARQVSDTKRLNTRLQDLNELIVESDYWAKKSRRKTVTEKHVQKAIDNKIARADRLREKMQESILRDINLISTEGKAIGQINGLSVYTLGHFMFGKPSRITAQVSLGKGQVLNIEREVDLSGPIHSKGVLILAGFLRGRYAENIPLSLSASLVFEQSYGGVDGDSASSTELYALLSAIARAPLKQSLAVTGSVNQKGEVQAIGGVNQKIEGFFNICKARGLTGDQGVLIPKANVKHLMLRKDVRDAVRKGKFHIYPVADVDEGISILTGIEAGERTDSGGYPDGSINARVKDRLEKMAKTLTEFGKSKDEKRE